MRIPMSGSSAAWTAIPPAALALLAALALAATDFPSRLVTYLSCFASGGHTDVQARIQEPSLRKLLGEPVVIPYNVGTGGALCWSEQAKSRPDGYTLASINVPHIILKPIGQPGAGNKTEGLESVMVFDALSIGLVVRKEIPFAKADMLDFFSLDSG